MTGTFGPILPFSKVEQWFLDTANLWFTDYLADVERELSEPPATFSPLADFGVSNEFEKWPEDHLPFLLVMYAGLVNRPRRLGTGEWQATALFGCSIIVSSVSRADVRYAMHAYGAAYKAMLLQHKDLGHPENIGGTSWVDERPASIPTDAGRSLGAIQMYYEVDITGITNDRGRPPGSAPASDPYQPPGNNPVITTPGNTQVQEQETP